MTHAENLSGARAAAQERFAVSVVKRLVQAGHRALFAGGCVRDRLRGVVPEDYDVATSAQPEDVMRLFKRTVAVGAAFGVVKVLGPRPDKSRPPLEVEVATFRTESGYRDGRHPDAVTFASEKEDVLRRDFTVNGLLYDPLEDRLVDLVGGRADLERKRLRAIGDPRTRFKEDRLRLLRAVRFAAALDFQLDPLTLSAIRKEAAAVTGVSAERIRDELTKMLSGPAPRRAMELLKSARLLRHVLPDVERMAGVAQPPEFHPEGDVWEHTLLALGQLTHASLTLAWGVLLHDAGKPLTFTQTDRIRFNEHEKVGAELAERILRDLRYPNEIVARVVELVRQHMVFKDVLNMRPATLKRFLRLPHFDEHLALHRIDCLACHGRLEAHDFCVRQLAKLGAEQLRPAPLLTGRDLQALGLKPGPRFGKILAEVEEKQLEGALASKSAALAYVRRYHTGALPKSSASG